MFNYKIPSVLLFLIYFDNVLMQNTPDCKTAGQNNKFWNPSCEEDGTYSAVQCKGEKLTGRCFCFNKFGKRIFGWSWWKTAEDMTCACSRHVEELKQKGRREITIHCTENGNYEELQCDNEICWCVDSKTGSPTQRVYPETLMKFLPCYVEDTEKSQYLRQCESKAVAEGELITTLQKHGRLFTHINRTNCDEDGSYGSYKIDENIIRCTWTDGNPIENYQTTIANALNVNCNCARDKIIFKTANSPFLRTCESNGNYQPLQSSSGYFYCVDSDGFPTTELGKFGEILKC